MSWGELNQWENKVYSQVKWYGNSTSLPWDPILQGIGKCMFMTMVATWKVLRKVQEDDVHRERVCAMTREIHVRVEGFLLWLIVMIELSSVEPVLKEEVLCRIR